MPTVSEQPDYGTTVVADGTTDGDAFDFDVDTPTETDEVDTVPAESDVVEDKPKAAKEKKAKKGDLPDGYVTPVGLAHALTEYYKANAPEKLGDKTDFPPQMVYSYIKNAPADDPWPGETVKDSAGKDRNVVKLDAGLEWFKRKDERAGARKANAATKAKEKAAKAEAKANEPAAAVDEGNPDVVEAE